MVRQVSGGPGGGKNLLGELHYSYVKSEGSESYAVPEFTYLTPDGVEQSVTGQTLDKTPCMDGSVCYLGTYSTRSPSKLEVPNTSFSVEKDTLVLRGYTFNALT